MPTIKRIILTFSLTVILAVVLSQTPFQPTKYVGNASHIYPKQTNDLVKQIFEYFPLAICL